MPPALALVGIAAFLWPTLGMPFLGDDTFNAYIDGWIGYEHLTLGTALVQFFQSTGFATGRFYPIFPLIIFFNYHVMHSIAATKLLTLAAILLNAASLYVLMRQFAPRLALPALVVLPAVLQIRYFHDALIQFSLHLQVAFEFTLLSAITFALYVRTRHIAYVLLSIALYLCATLTYEATYAFVVPLIMLVFSSVRNVRERCALAALYTAIPLALSALIVVVRTHLPVPASSPYAITLLPGPIFRVVALQVLGALPLSYAMANPNHSLPPIATMLEVSPGAWIAATVAFGLNVFAFRAPAELPGAKRALEIAFFAFIVVLASTAMICLSPRWQAELKIGLAYTPVYFEVFAMAVILAALASIVAKVVPYRAGVLLVSASFAIVIGTTYSANALTLAQYVPWSSVVPDALDAGLLRIEPAGSTIYLDDSYPAHARDEGGTWNVKYYLFAHTHTKLVAAHLSSLPPAVAPNAFALAAEVPDFRTGRVVAGPIASVAREGSGNVALIARAKVYEVRGAEATLKTWISDCGALPIANVVTKTSSALLVRYDPTFSVLERDGSTVFHWSRGGARIVFANPTSVVRRATVSFVIRPASAAPHVRYAVGTRIRDVPSNGGDIAANAKLVVAGHANTAISIDTDNPPIPRDPAGRILRFQIRDLRVSEAACRV